MTNLEWMKKRILKEVDTLEKMADAMINGFKFDDLDETIAVLYCHPEKVGCDTEEVLNDFGYTAPCHQCALKWLKEEH